MLDCLIEHAAVFDGNQVDPQELTVGIRDDRIAYVGPPLGSGAASRRIDAAGLYLCPGFIDTHASTGLGYRFPHAGDNKLFQGVTTEIIGNCGTSPGPVAAQLAPEMERLSREIGFQFDWRTLAEWFRGVEEHGLPFNVGTFVGHSTIRAGLGVASREVSREDLAGMRALVDEGMRDGALGLSTGLVYAPGSFADTEEILALARVAARHGGIYVSHVRDERDRLEASIEEGIEIGRGADLPVLVSHLKAGERRNWGKIPGVIGMIEAARREGIRITFEVYPYTATSTKLRTFLPKQVMEGGIEEMERRLRETAWRERSRDWLISRGTDFDAMTVISDGDPEAAGKSIAAIAQGESKHPADSVLDLLMKDPDAWIVYDCISPDDMDAAILWEHSIVCSDSWSYPVNAPRQIGTPHPRTFGAFTRFLQRYTLETGRLPFGQAVRKITSQPAWWLGLRRRGSIREGNYADLVLLDPGRVQERATFDDPRQLSQGTEYLWVNGTLVLEKGALLDRLPGRILRKPPARDSALGTQGRKSQRGRPPSKSGNVLSIRDAEPEDAAVIAEIYNESIAAGDATMDDQLKTESDIRGQIEGFGPRECYLLLERDGRVLGWGVIKSFGEGPAYRFCCETSVYLRRSQIRRGYGSFIKRALLERCRQYDYRHLAARIFASNRASIEYNKTFGYRMVGIQKEIGFKNGKWQDVAVMELVLEDT